MPSQKLQLALETIMERNRQNAIRAELFAKDPTCGICTAEIEQEYDCSPVRLANGTQYLCHHRCFQMQIEQMALRFFGRPA